MICSGLNCLLANEIPPFLYFQSNIISGLVFGGQVREADAAVVSKDFGHQHEKVFNVVKTAIFFQPSSLYFAFPKNSSLTPYLIDRIDHHIKGLKQDYDSIYYQSLEKRFGVKPIEKSMIPKWVIWTLIGVGGLALLLVGGNLILRSQVKSKTKLLIDEITVRGQTEKELRKSEDKFRNFIESTPLGVAITTPEGKTTMINPAILKIFGYSSEEEFLALPTSAHYYHPEDRGQFVKQLLDKGMVNNFEVQCKRKNGSVFWGSLTSVAQKTPDGTTWFVNSFEDITQRKNAEVVLKISEERYRILMEHANEAITVAQDGMLKFANPKTAELSGYSIEELASIPFADIIHPDDRDTVVERYLRGLQGDVHPSIYSFKVIDKAGNIKWTEINAVSIIWEGKPATLNFLTDITERKQAEQQSLVTAKMASLGELVAGVAHEINNPLTGIIGYAQLLADRQDVPQNVKEDLQKIHEESQRTVKIVQNLLHFARQYKPEKRLVDINELIKRTLELETYKLRTSNVGLSTKLAANIPLILADYNQLQQVILNIVTNARQAITETKRKGRITITTETIEDYVRIAIADNGPRISPENITRIFDPFFTTKPAGSGSGLGLSICHSIITEHGGKIYAESTKDKETTLTIELPIATGEQAVIIKKPAEKKSRRPRRKMTGDILIAEDEPAIRAVLRRNLSARGHQVQVVSDGKAALAKLAKNNYRLIIADLKMPGMGGRELYKAMKKKYPDLTDSIVFITGDVMTADTRDFLASTGRPYLIKPFDSKDIIDVIDKVLAKSNR